MALFGILLLVLAAVVSCDLGDSCGKNRSGKCILASNCKTAVDALMRRKHHGLERCGFQGKEEIVCCPDDQDLLKNPKLRKCVIACNSFKSDGLDFYPYILGGENASLGEFPHMAALGYEDETTNEYNFECGGSLISDTFVLTAAHCLVRADQKDPTIVRVGKVDLLGMEDEVPPQDIPVAKTYPHQGYDWQARINDIGIVQLTRSVKRDSNVRPICLHTEDDDPPGLVVVGWGKTGNTREGSKFLLKTALQPVNLKECNVTFGTRAFGKPVFDTHLCAKSNDSVPRDTCQGDSGGPMQIEEARINGTLTLASLVAVTSYGPLCGGALPSIYTRVSRYLDWIEEIVWP